MASPTTGSARIVVPGAGHYRMDPERSAITFTTRHLFGLGAVRGTFRLREGTIHVAEPAIDSWARAVIPAGSFHTGNKGRDLTVLSARMLDVTRYPDILFNSTGVELLDGRWLPHGSLSVCGVANPIGLAVETCIATDGGLRLTATARVDRFEFGIRHSRGLAARHLTLRLDIVAERS